ncbi:MAG: glycosyltransferase [Muribaculaceae bacterium]|nr:glycosyltransferase [Muribaculaceae bacterium]
MEAQLVSVIVPVYNVKSYLPRCLESIVAQDYSPLEVILVDDGSDDGSSELCDEWAAQDARIKVIHKANEGPGQARNAGLDVAQGQYVSFIDSDDYVHPQFISRLHRHAVEQNAEVVLCRWVEFDGDKLAQLPPVTDKPRLTEMTGMEALRRIFYQDEITHSPWGRLYRSDLFAEHRFSEKYVYEDLELIYPLLKQVHKVVETDERLYGYMVRSTSLMRTFNAQRTVVLDIMDDLEQKVAANDPELLPAVRSRRLSANFNMLKLMPRDDAHYAPIFDRCWAAVKELRWGCLKDCRVRLKNKLGILLSFLGKKATIVAINRSKD